jgi:SAM-dependent methyltransferase
MAQKMCYAASKNKELILDILKPLVESFRVAEPHRQIKILEVASGTGEHMNLFCSSISNLYYQPTDPDIDMHESIRAWTEAVPGNRVNPPVSFDISNEVDLTNNVPEDFTNGTVDVMICINMIHISPFVCTEGLFRTAARCLQPHGKLLTYGPYRVDGHMVESNVAFDEYLKKRNPEWGVRDKEAVEQVANNNGFKLVETVAMPANNLSLIFSRRS